MALGEAHDHERESGLCDHRRSRPQRHQEATLRRKREAAGQLQEQAAAALRPASVRSLHDRLRATHAV